MDWKLPLFILQAVTTLITLAGFIIIKTNDLKHLHIEVKENKKRDEENKKEIVDIVKEYTKETNKQLDKIFKEIRKIDKLQVKRDTVCNIRHGNNK